MSALDDVVAMLPIMGRCLEDDMARVAGDEVGFILVVTDGKRSTFCANVDPEAIGDVLGGIVKGIVDEGGPRTRPANGTH